MITGALDGSFTVDNRFITSDGRASIADDFVNFDENLAQMGEGLKNNIVTKSIENAYKDDSTSLLQAIGDYIETDRKVAQAVKDLGDFLNGATRVEDPEQLKQLLQQVVDLAGANGGFTGDLSISNIVIEDGVFKGLAYQSNDGTEKHITLNLGQVDLANPNELINAIFHETTNFDRHTNSEQTATNRGDTAEGIWGLKNYGNQNTNLMSGSEWVSNNGGSSVFTEGNTNLVQDLKNHTNNNGQANTIFQWVEVINGNMTLEQAQEISDMTLPGYKIIAGAQTAHVSTVGGGSVITKLLNKVNEALGKNNKNVEQSKPELTPQDARGVRSLEKRIKEHEIKLNEFKNNPTVKPGMENQPPSVINQQQQARIRHLEKEIETFKNNIDKIINGAK